MYRATTPKHIFYFNVDPNETFSEILITYAQSGRIILEKHKSDLTFDDKPGQYKKYGAWFRLTQEETKLFSDDYTQECQIQVRVRTNDGEVVAGPIQTVSVKAVLNDEVL